MKIEIGEELNIRLPNGNMLSLTPYLWNEFKLGKGKKNKFGFGGKWDWYLITGHCNKNAKEFKKEIFELYNLKIV